MRRAYALLGLSFLIIMVGSYVALEKVHTPVTEISNNKWISSMTTLTLSSPAFGNNENIPAKYTCDGEETNPPLEIRGVPLGTKSLVLLMRDPDISQKFKEANHIDAYDHWVLYNIKPDIQSIKEGDLVGDAGLSTAGTQLYVSPCPPAQSVPPKHRYIFDLYALSGTLTFSKVPTLREVESSLQGMLIEKTTLTGLYERTKGM